MGGEFDGLCAVQASGTVCFYAFLAYFGALHLIVSIQQNWEELRLWLHRRRYARFMRASRKLRL
jgi:hypothetical protein